MIIRYLLIGAKQFKDFLEGSLCIDTNLLSNGLTLLRALKIVEKSEPVGSKVTHIVRTDERQGLDPIIAEVARWSERRFRKYARDKYKRCPAFSHIIQTLLVVALTLQSDGCSSMRTSAPEDLPPYVFVDLTNDFADFHDSSGNLSGMDRVSAFKHFFSQRFPGFYDARRIPYFSEDEYDDSILLALKQFPQRRAALEARAASFAEQLGTAFQSFEKAFPDIRPIGTIYMLYSMNEFDGGVRSINGQDYLVFGIDVMDRVHDFEDETPFFHHELFHVYHAQYFAPCDALWCSLWSEGLAVAVAQSLNPNASDAQLLLTAPRPLRAAVDANAEEAVCAISGHFDVTDDEIYGSVFGSGQWSDTLPPRFGYYLGLRLVHEAMKFAPISTLAMLPVDDAKLIVENSLCQLANCSHCQIAEP